MSLKSHKKSKRGCATCKQRKVKCGEELPMCHNCIKRGQMCTYAARFRFKPVEPQDSVAHGLLAPNFSPQTLLSYFPAETCARMGTPGDERILELQLMHFHTVSTYQTWSSLREIWVAAAPLAAFRYSYLLDAMLAVSARHWSDAFPQDRTWAETASTHYHARALTAYNQALSGLSQQSNAMPLFFTSALFYIYSLSELGKATFDADDDAFFTCLRLARGCNMVYATHSRMLNGSEVMKSTYKRVPEIASQETLFAPKNGQPLFLLIDELARATNVDDQERAVYQNAIRRAGFIYRPDKRKDSASVLIRRLVTFLNHCDERFIQYLEERRPRALVIVANAFAALNLLQEQLWWSKGLSQYINAKVSSMISSEWHHLMPQSKPMSVNTDSEELQASGVSDCSQASVQYVTP